jgi:Mg-chelatase subunit ChlI
MDVDPLEAAKAAKEEPATTTDRPLNHLNTMVAITVALLATFMGVCKVKDDNIVQAMQLAQTERVDNWNFYQARNIREEIANATLIQLKLSAGDAPAARQAAYANAIAEYEKLAANQGRKKLEQQQAAKDAEAKYEELNFRDDQFDMSDALLALAIALLAVTALTEKTWLYWIALIPTAGGVVMGLAGLLKWQISFSALSKMLS